MQTRNTAKLAHIDAIMEQYAGERERERNVSIIVCLRVSASVSVSVSGVELCERGQRCSRQAL